MKLLILIADSNGGSPVPAVKGGAVSTLVEHLVSGNNEKKLCDMEVMSLYDKAAEEKANEQYPNVKFRWVKVPGIIKLLDKLAFNVIRIIKKNGKIISYKSAFSLIYYIFKAKKYVNKCDSDIVIMENNVPLIRVMKHSKYKGKWYYHFHNVPRIDAGCRDEFKKIDRFLCVSQYVSDQITSEKSAIGKMDSDRVSVLYNCVNTDLFRPIDKDDQHIRRLKYKYGYSEGDFIVIFAGRLSEEKGADKLLKALLNTDEKVKCIIVGAMISSYNGKSKFQEKLSDLASQLNGRVTFTGYVNQSEMPYYYNMADLAVLPSIWEEPAGLTNLEAMACGIPVITTDAGGISEYAKEAVQLKRVEDIESAISNEIMHIVQDSRYREQIAKKGYSEVVGQFNSKQYIDKLVEIIND